MENNIRAVLQRNLNIYIKNSRLSQKEIAELFSIEQALNSSTLILNGGQSETKVELRYYDYTLLMCFMLPKKK